MTHHTEESKCPKCAEFLAGCNPDLVDIFYTGKEEFPDLHIYCGFRGQKEQEEVFKIGLSNAPWGKSRHNIMKDGKPYSEAMDLFRLNEEGQAEFERKYFLELAQFYNKLDLDIEWSGDWKNKKVIESNHFQLKRRRK